MIIDGEGLRLLLNSGGFRSVCVGVNVPNVTDGTGPGTMPAAGVCSNGQWPCKRSRLAPWGASGTHRVKTTRRSQ